MDSLPIELFGHILRAVFDGTDKSTFSSCSLVCKQWNVASRPYMFRRIRIGSEDRLDGFKALLESKPDVGPYVSELVIHPATGQIPEPVNWLAKFPVSLSSLLIQVRTIELVHLWEGGDSMTLKFFEEFSKFKTVTKLMVRDSFMAPSVLRALPCALPALQEFCVGDLFPVSSAPWNGSPYAHDPSLSSLCLQMGYRWPEPVDEGLAWALSTGSRETLRSLSLQVHFSEARAITNHLTVLGGQLRHLELRLGMTMGTRFEYEMIKDDLHIHACTGLETLTLHCTLPACPCMVMLLTEIASPHIRKVSISLSGDDVTTLPSCQGLADPLSGVNLQTLSEVLFIYDGALAQQIILDKLRADLPAVHLRGLLRVISPAVAQIFQNSGKFGSIFLGGHSPVSLAWPL